MDVLPSSLDLVAIGTVWRQKVENQSMAFRRVQTGLDQWCRMNHVVIQNDMDLPGLRVSQHQFPQREDKQHRIFVITRNVNQFSRPCVLRTGEIAILVLSGCGHLLLLANQHPVLADLWI